MYDPFFLKTAFGLHDNAVVISSCGLCSSVLPSLSLSLLLSLSLSLSIGLSPSMSLSLANPPLFIVSKLSCFESKHVVALLYNARHRCASSQSSRYSEVHI